MKTLKEIAIFFVGYVNMITGCVATSWIAESAMVHYHGHPTAFHWIMGSLLMVNTPIACILIWTRVTGVKVKI